MITWIWIISLIVLIASSVFVYKMLITSSELLSTDRWGASRLLRMNARDKKLRQSLEELNAKMKTLEDANSYYVMQFSRLQKQVDTQEAEKLENLPAGSLTSQAEEDWEEMYYQENEAKVLLENELDTLRQELEMSDKRYLSLQEENENHLAKLKSKHDIRLEEITSLKNQIDELQKQLNASFQRERALTTEVQKVISQKNDYACMQSENVRLQSEIKDQRRQLTELFQKEEEHTKKLARLGALESQISLYEENQRMAFHQLESKLNENKVFTDFR